MAFNNYLEDENDKPYFKMNSLAYYYDKMEGFAKAVEGSAKALNLTKEEIEQRITLRLAEWDKNLESFDGSVEKLLTEWVDDGTLNHVIDSTLIDHRIAPVTAQMAETTQELSESTGGNKATWSVWEEFERRGINVTWFGAKGDNQNDDTDSLQAAFNKGGVIFAPANKVFKISKELVVTKPLILNFNNSKIIANDDFVGVNLISSTTGDIHINDIFLDGGEKEVNGLYIYESTTLKNISLNNTKFFNMRNSAFYIKNAEILNISKTEIVNCSYSDTAYTGASRIATSKNVVVEDIIFKNCCGRGFVFESGIDLFLNNFFISDMKVNSLGEVWESLYINSSKDVSLSNGTIKRANATHNVVKFSGTTRNLNINKVDFYYDSLTDLGLLIRIQGANSVYFRGCKFICRVPTARSMFMLSHHPAPSESVTRDINFSDCDFLGIDDGINNRPVFISTANHAVAGEPNESPYDINFYGNRFKHFESAITLTNAVNVKIIDNVFHDIRALAVSLRKTNTLAIPKDCIVKGNTFKATRTGHTIQGINIDGHTNTLLADNAFDIVNTGLEMRNVTSSKILNNSFKITDVPSLAITGLNSNGNVVAYNDLSDGDDLVTASNKDQYNLR